jgi:hypothetical protein
MRALTAHKPPFKNNLTIYAQQERHKKSLALHPSINPSRGASDTMPSRAGHNEMVANIKVIS